MAPADVAFWLASAGILGIGAAGLAIPLAIAFVVAGVGWFAVSRPRRFSFAFAVLLSVVFVLGHLYYNVFAAAHRTSEHIPVGSDTETTGVVRDEPRRSERALRFTLELDEPYHGRLGVVTEPSRAIHYGDRLTIAGRIEEAESGGNPLSIATAVFPRVTLIARDAGPWLMTRLMHIREALIGVIERALPTERAALLAGLLFGDTRGFTSEFRDAMAASGTTHLTALSGYNIAVLIESVSLMCAWFMLSRRMRFFATILFVLLFVLMVGAEASVVRAAIMGSLVLLAGETGRAYHVRNAMAFAALAMLLIDPTLLVWSAGFLLSFLSLIGIVYMRPALQHLCGMRTDHDGAGIFGWREHVLMTSAAQLMVLPVIMRYFGEFSLTAIIANVMILEFVPFAMFLGFLLIAIGFILPPAIPFFAGIAEIPLAYMGAVIRFFADVRVPIASAGGWGVTVCMYAVLFAVIALGRRTPSHIPRNDP
ncbi:MAG: hypothetical protein RL681_829 [Candidatus Parcubacteria bacterium]|jgi:competence protein ComEC